MKCLLICPSSPAGVPVLAERAPLAALPLLGSTPLAYWLVHVAGQGARQVTVIAADRPDAIRAVTGDGARWGLAVDVIPATSELTVEQARVRYRAYDPEPWLPEPDAIVRLDHLPGQPARSLYAGYGAWFEAAQSWMSRARTPDRIGVREIAPGVLAGWRSRISPTATLLGPCWIGEKAYVGPAAVIGPHSVVEDRSVVEAGASVVRSVVGPETLVGKDTEVTDSLAWGDVLVDWRRGSVLRVPDAFLLCALGSPLSAWRPADLLRRWWTGGRRVRRPDADGGVPSDASRRNAVLGTGN